MAEIFPFLLQELGSNAKCLKSECLFGWFHCFPAQANGKAHLEHAQKIVFITIINKEP